MLRDLSTQWSDMSHSLEGEREFIGYFFDNFLRKCPMRRRGGKSCIGGERGARGRCWRG